MLAVYVIIGAVDYDIILLETLFVGISQLETLLGVHRDAAVIGRRDDAGEKRLGVRVSAAVCGSDGECLAPSRPHWSAVAAVTRGFSAPLQTNWSSRRFNSSHTRRRC